MSDQEKIAMLLQALKGVVALYGTDWAADEGPPPEIAFANAAIAEVTNEA